MYVDVSQDQHALSYTSDLATHSISKTVYYTLLCKLFTLSPRCWTSLRLRPSFTEHMLLPYPVEVERIAAAVLVIQAVADTQAVHKQPVVMPLVVAAYTLPVVASAVVAGPRVDTRRLALRLSNSSSSHQTLL